MDKWKQNENASVGENILLHFLRDENGDFWKRISVAGALPTLALHSDYVKVEDVYDIINKFYAVLFLALNLD